MNMYSAVVPSRRAFCAAIFTLVLALPLSACGPSEPQQRQAFITFLKTRIVDKPGIHMPVPKADERISWGPYAAQFDVIADSNHALDDASRKAFGDFSALAASARSIGALGVRTEVVRIRDGAATFQSTIKQRLEIANAARAAFLPQPDDLKTVYSAAYERDVSGPAVFWMDAMPAMQQAMTSYLNVIDFIEQHKGSVTINGPIINASDPKLMPRLNELINAMNNAAAKTVALFNKAQNLTYGR